MTSSSITRYSQRGALSLFMEEARTTILNFIIIGSFLFTCYKFYKTFYGENGTMEKSEETVKITQKDVKSSNEKYEKLMENLQKQLKQANEKYEKTMENMQRQVKQENEKAEKAIKKLKIEVQLSNEKAKNLTRELEDLKQQFAILKEERNVGESKNAKEFSFNVNDMRIHVKQVLWYIERGVPLSEFYALQATFFNEIEMYTIIDALRGSKVKALRIYFDEKRVFHKTAIKHLCDVLPESEMEEIQLHHWKDVDNNVDKLMPEFTGIKVIRENYSPTLYWFITEKIHNKNGVFIKGTGGNPEGKPWQNEKMQQYFTLKLN